ncbi:mannose-1-phosphate guanylyltransferase [Acidobacteriota bacterium]
MDIHAIILAGGIGTRFWPLSRKKTPKQLLPIVSEKTMIEETVNRLLPQISPAHIYTVSNDYQTQELKKILPSLPVENFIVEPQGKNTAPSLILATATIYLQNPKAVIAALPADHLIKKPSLFLKKLMAGAAAASKGAHLVTFGIPPSYPATGYGYIQFSAKSPTKTSGENFYLIENFKEKPDYNQAKEFLKSGNYFWNSGMFIWQAETFVEQLKKHAPVFFSYWKKILEVLMNKEKNQIKKIFQSIPSISIDYALMEKAQGALMCEGNFGWSDVGAWSALTDIWPQDKNRNTFRGDSIVLDSESCLVYSPKKLIALAGVKDLIVVDTDDALLICHKDQDQKVKDLVEEINLRGKKEYL